MIDQALRAQMLNSNCMITGGVVSSACDSPGISGGC